VPLFADVWLLINDDVSSVELLVPIVKVPVLYIAPPLFTAVLVEKVEFDIFELAPESTVKARRCRLM